MAQRRNGARGTAADAAAVSIAEIGRLGHDPAARAGRKQS